MTLTRILEGALLGVLIEYFRVRFAWKSAVRALQSFKEEQAARVAAALSNSTLVDGVELPKPDDERWVCTHDVKLVSALLGETTHSMIELGLIKVSDEDCIYVGHGYPMANSENTKKYCADVWKAYRSRVARKAIETT